MLRGEAYETKCDCFFYGPAAIGRRTLTGWHLRGRMHRLRLRPSRCAGRPGRCCRLENTLPVRGITGTRFLWEEIRGPWPITSMTPGMTPLISVNGIWRRGGTRSRRRSAADMTGGWAPMPWRLPPDRMIPLYMTMRTGR